MQWILYCANIHGGVNNTNTTDDSLVIYIKVLFLIFNSELHYDL